MFPLTAAPLLHFLLETLGVLLALAYYRRLRAGRKDLISDADRASLLIAAAFGAFVGSRLLGSLESPELFFSGGGPLGWSYYLTSKTIVGGLLGGLFSIEATKATLGVRHRSGDVYVFPLILATILGRIGCFLMGVGEPTYGIPTNGPLGIDLGDGIPRHATALYEIVFLLLFWWLLARLQRKLPLRPGRLFMLYLSGYLLYRFLVGFIQPTELLHGLNALQWACLLGFVWYLGDEVVSWWRLRRTN